MVNVHQTMIATYWVNLTPGAAPDSLIELHAVEKSIVYELLLLVGD